MNIYCIVVTYNGAKWVEKCFGSLYNSSVPVKIIAIDNASTDYTVTLIHEKFPLVEVINTGSNLGFGKANNIGLKRALQENADYVFLLNQDAWIEPALIKKLIEVAVKNPDFGIESPFHFNYAGSAIEKYFNDYVIGQYSSEYISDLHFNTVKPIYISNFIHAACWLLPINTIKKVGGFDPLFFHYGEDNDYVQRLLFKDLKIGFIPNANLYHFGTNEELANPGKNIFFKINQSALQLKNPNATMPGAILVFLKSSFDAITSAILYRNFKQLKIELKAFWFNLKRLNRIVKSRKLQRMEMAYLTSDN